MRNDAGTAERSPIAEDSAVTVESSVGTLTNACSIEKIRTELMSDPSQEKIRYYEQYYQKTKKLPHAIVVDEDKQLTDGYISYLLEPPV